VDKGHGRLETRTIRTSTVLNDYLDFPGLGQVFRLERERVFQKSRKVERETVHGLTSLTPQQADPARLLKLNRDHWSIENKSHYVRDMAYDEDRSQVRANQGPQVMAALRNFVISLLRLAGFEKIVSALRACARSSRRALRLLGVY
jgi:predicted transposase YbfD/YdcC